MIVAIVLYNFKLFYLNSVISTKIPVIYIISKITMIAFSFHRIVVNVLLIMINILFHRDWNFE